ncbi:MAG: serine hydrolase [Patescibacteria group bacterium]
MDSQQLHQLAKQKRSNREVGITLLISSAILALFLFVPLDAPAPPTPIAAPPTTTAFDRVPIEATAAIVYDLATGETLFAKNADAQLPLASLTKLLTVYTALQYLALDTPITIPREATTLEAPRAFAAGQVFSLSDVARLTLTASLNDGAAAILAAAAAQMDRTPEEALAGAAAALNLSQTYAVNGSGLDVTGMISGGYGSARDLALLSGALVERAPTVAAATTLPEASATSKGGTSFTVLNTDPIVETIPHILLSKTGYTNLADGNLALVFDVGIDHPIAVVVLGSSKTARFTDGAALVAATLAHFAGVSSL